MPVFDPSTLELVCDGLEYPEGPVAMPDGSILVVEIRGQRVTRVHPDGTTEKVADVPGGPNGAAVGPDGKLWIANSGGFCWKVGRIPRLKPEKPEDPEDCEVPEDSEDHPTLPNGQVMWLATIQAPDYQGGFIQRIALDTPAGEAVEVETVYSEFSESTMMVGLGKREAKVEPVDPPLKLKGPDDLVFDGEGGFWFADYGKSRPRDKDQTGVFYAKADGTGLREMAHPLDSPNGIALSPDKCRVYASLTFQRALVYWELSDPGVIAPNPASLDGMYILVPQVRGQSLLDSIRVDEAGNIYVLTMLPQTSVLVNGGIAVVSPDGDVIDFLEIKIPDRYAPMPSNMCWAGKDRKTAYITCGASGMLVKVRTTIAGLKLAY
jgi:gluconolactonase